LEDIKGQGKNQDVFRWSSSRGTIWGHRSMANEELGSTSGLKWTRNNQRGRHPGRWEKEPKDCFRPAYKKWGWIRDRGGIRGKITKNLV